MGNQKRKGSPAGADGEQHGKKRKHGQYRIGGTEGRWKTPFQQTKEAQNQGQTGQIEVGDAGVWVTCARNMEARATRELRALFYEYAKKFYGVTSEADTGKEAGEEEEEGGDIEASIQKELDSMKGAPREGSAEHLFTNVRMPVDCLLFMKTKAPVEPVELVYRICQDAKIIESYGQRQTRYINRFVPVSYTGKATESGVNEVARRVLAPHFSLKDAGEEAEKAAGPQQSEAEEARAYSYAIRPSFRNHKTLKRDAVITQIAGLIDPRHKVDLTKPDKVILVDIYTTFCGMSVVGGDWDALKKYNIHELYNLALSDVPESADGKSTEA